MKQTVIQLTSDDKKQAIQALTELLDHINGKTYNGIIFESMVLSFDEDTKDENTVNWGIRNRVEEDAFDRILREFNEKNGL